MRRTRRTMYTDVEEREIYDLNQRINRLGTAIKMTASIAPNYLFELHKQSILELKKVNILLERYEH